MSNNLMSYHRCVLRTAHRSNRQKYVYTFIFIAPEESRICLVQSRVSGEAFHRRFVNKKLFQFNFTFAQVKVYHFYGAPERFESYTRFWHVRRVLFVKSLFYAFARTFRIHRVLRLFNVVGTRFPRKSYYDIFRNNDILLFLAIKITNTM